MRAKAFSAQHRHDFDLARELLTEVLRRDPTDAGALLSRAQVNIVQGRLKNARGDCVSLALRVDAGLGTICTAALQLRRADYPSAARLADRWLMGSEASTGLKRFVLMMRGDIASRMKAPEATNFYQQALALDPQDVRTRLAFARHLRRSAQPRKAIAVLESAAASDTVLLQRALAVREAGMPDAQRWGDQLGRRFALARQTGTSTELRDEAEYYLTVRQNPKQGLKLALENFQTQRDLEDEELLEQAAKAMRQPEALQVLRDWEHDQESPAARSLEDKP